MDEETKKTLGEATQAVLETRAKVEKNEIGIGEMQERIDKIAPDLVKAEKALQLVDQTAKRMDEIETRMETMKEIQTETEVEPTEHRDAVREFLRTAGGKKMPMSTKAEEFFASKPYMEYASTLTNIEGHTLTEGTMADGGLFVHPELDAMIIKNYVAIDPIRSVAQVRTITTNVQEGYRRTGTPTAYHGSELAGSTESQSSWAEYKIPVNPLYSVTKVSSDMLDDVRFIESEIAEDAGEAYGYTEGVDFLEGTGVDRAQGVFYKHGTDANKYVADVAGVGTQLIDGDDIATMYTTLGVPYRPNSTWAFNSDSLKALLLLKESTTEAYIWQPGLQSGPPNFIYGRPYIICESMDDEGNDKYPIMLADFSKLYRIVDRSGIQLLRDIYTAYPAVYIKTRKRLGGQVIKPEAGKILKTT